MEKATILIKAMLNSIVHMECECRCADCPLNEWVDGIEESVCSIFCKVNNHFNDISNRDGEMRIDE